MSLILEALRKSEAERRRGQSPDLYAELPPVARMQRQPMPIWLWLVIGVAAFAMVLWLLYSLRPPLAPAAIGTTASDVAAGDIGHTAASNADAPRVNPSTAYTPPVRTVQPTRNPTPDVATPPSPVVAPPPAPAATPDAAAIAPPPTAAPEPLPAPPPPAPVASNDDLLQLADLSAEERKQLPPLKLSMHMWNDAPAQRFVIIDGHRLAEGDRIGNMVLEAIRTDGVVLDWNGRRFKLPIR
ncbi:general secretion pathway protein GspB [Lysobacter sp. CFH 32150]|uniref:general secretion pathway protein GspB n=1 Tax=Lysobacter sp. CFH 32150 TaxID=2927128 RepID=UPI001FA77689|nr:general secretion pathway protein GspB [Lysobacter sp. CFH 32150]MCI4569343.1 general secretion pathway protein GspB [Lysobacter sp. CFH 32150]